MKTLSLTVAACLFSTASFAQSLNCAALANSAGFEPAGYAAECLSSQPAPSVATGVNAPTSTATTLDIRGQAPRLPNSLYSFTLNAFQTQTLLGTSAQGSIFAMDYNVAGTTLFAVTGSAAAPNPSTLGTLSSTGVFTAIAPVTGLTAGDSATGLAIHPRTGVAYFAAAGGTPALSRLYTLNLTTGAATLIGTITAPTDPTGTLMIDISANCDGDLYGHNISDDALYQINPTTGAGTARPTHGLAANFAQGMDFDNDTGTLYAFIYTGTGTNRFGTFNLATGAFTALSTDNPLGEYEGAIPTACPSAITVTSAPTNNGAFGPLPVTGTGTRNFSFSATGSGSVLLSCAITGPNAGNFSVAPASQTLNGGASVNFAVSATAPAAGTISATLTCSGTGAGPFTFALTGSAAIPQAPAFSNLGLLALGLLVIGLGIGAARRFS